MTTTAAAVIANAMHMFGITDVVEQPTAADFASNVPILNDLLRSEYPDAAATFLMKTVAQQVPAGVSGSIYTFQIGTAQPSYLVQQDVVGVKAIWVNDVSPTVNRETRQGPKADVVRTTYPGRITKWHQERQQDGSVLVYAWQPPAFATQILLEMGGRVPLISNPLGTDMVPLPPEGIHDITLLLGLTICGGYGRPSDKLDPALLARAKATDDRWRQWARGQQWLRFVRA